MFIANQGVGLASLAHSLVVWFNLCMGESEPVLVIVTLIVHVAAKGYQRCKHGLAKSRQLSNILLRMWFVLYRVPQISTSSLL